MPNFQYQMAKSQRNAAKLSLIRMAAQLEQGHTVQKTLNAKRYHLQIESKSPTQYRLTAVATRQQAQWDKTCSKLILDSSDPGHVHCDS